MEEFERRKKDLRHELRAARSNIHISFDMWTSPNCYAIMAVIAHYIDSNGKLQAKLIALRYLEGEHTSENMAALLLKVFREYKIGVVLASSFWTTRLQTTLALTLFFASFTRG